MAVDFKSSKTKENLMKAFAGESQARNRYTIAAETAEKQNMQAISSIFRFTAEQERAMRSDFTNYSEKWREPRLKFAEDIR